MENKHTFKEWVLATRPWSFPASAMPVLVTIFWSWHTYGSINWWFGLWALVNIILVHAAGNVWSDIADYRSGVDAPDTFGVRQLVDQQFTIEEFRRLSVSLNIVAVVCGLGLVALTGLPLLCIGIVGILLSLGYPFLKYHALGDFVIIMCYSVLPMLGTSFIVTEVIRPEVLWLAVPVGLITVAILHVNNVRDIETDTRAGIQTFPQLTGRRFGVAIYVFEVLFPFLWLVGIVVAGIVPVYLLLALLALVPAVRNVRTIMSYRQGIATYARLDEQTAQLQLAFSLLVVVALTLSSLL